MLILVLNSGSSSIKFQLHRLQEPSTANRSTVLVAGQVERLAGVEAPSEYGQTLSQVNQQVIPVLSGQKIDVIGHRVVHGGELFTEPTVLTDEVIGALEQLTHLAPLHIPQDVAGIRAAATIWPGIPQVAVFDTAFHRTLPESAWRFAIPDDLYLDHGIRRYGFHGISLAFVTDQASSFLGIPSEALDGIVAHLGNGASVTAIRGGRSIDTSMGFTPVDGLVMGTRCGDLDPSVILFLQRRGLDADAIEELLNRKSGLRALCGTSDMRSVEEAAQAGQARAVLAMEIAAYRLAKYIGGYHVAVGGAKVLVFTGGIGENSAAFRSLVLGKLAPLGIVPDGSANEGGATGTRLISSACSSFPVLVVPTDEASVIAAAAASLLPIP
ncbi:acetate kinase [Arthrobacter sp. AQ5-05]|uniref:acetate/propionate family kinase n=1 Tax=Arthrobacter sp. AQ5-05 TaxID=2184581 RepID=UPI000DCE5F14|nr:acetate/propionate family kinase [Arthrobacter sp. AQ5-05]RAX48648.1 acetate kinase [Arthrobacter sp. AQ5-05]